jgi:hypothetical protein
MGEPLRERLPDEVMIAGVRVLVEEDELDERFGQWVMEAPWRIIISPTMSIREQWYTLFHEMVHALHDIIDWRLGQGHIERPSDTQ